VQACEQLYDRCDASVCFGDFLAAAIIAEGGARCPGQPGCPGQRQPSWYFMQDIDVKTEVHQDGFHACGPCSDSLVEFQRRVD
jgi:hypothetical protein